MTKTSGDREQPEKPKKPQRQVRAIHYRYQVEQVFELRKLLKEALELEFLGTTPANDTFDRLVCLVREILPGNVDYKTLEDSLRHLAGTRLDERELDATAWRMAGNFKRLADRKAVPPWHVQRLPEWVPAQVVSCRRERTGRGKLGAVFGFRLLAGTSCGLTAEKFWTLKFCRVMASDFGFSRSFGTRTQAYPYTAPEQFVGLRAYVRVMPSLCGKEPGFDGLGFPSSLSGWNKTTLKCRFRVQPGFRCAMGMLPTQLPCHNCPVGFLKCRAGTHRQNWVEKACSGCEKEDAFFDPESASDLCVDCTVRATYKGDK